MTKRIHWEPVDGTVTSWFGYVGSAKAPLFQVLHPVTSESSDARFHEWALAATFAQNETRYGGTSPDAPDELKAEAERWLTEFARSLGVAFLGESPKVTVGKPCPSCGYRDVHESSPSAPGGTGETETRDV